jgi:Osmosensitive K+ channel histidine kinase
MRTLKRVFFLGEVDGRRGRRYVIDMLVGLVSALLVTLAIYSLRLYPRIPNISILYLLVVLGLASTRGLYAAVVASLVAFISFDFFLVSPVFTLRINDAPEWLALCIFLITAILTGQQAAAVRQRAAEALQRARESRALYELVNAATNEDNLERQLTIVARALVNNFRDSGVRDCAILLPDVHGSLVLQANAHSERVDQALSLDEIRTAQSVLENGTIVDLYSQPDTSKVYAVRRVVTSTLPLKEQRFVRFIPLQQGPKVVGVARLLMAGRGQKFPPARTVPPQRTAVATATDEKGAFFWTFLDQAITMIERARLRREAMQIELLRRTDALRSALLSSVSHDLRTPLSSIKAAASSLLQDDVDWDKESQRGFALAIEREADRLNRLVGNLLDMSRIEGGALKPEKEWYPIDELIHDVLAHMHSTLQAHPVQLTVADNLPPVELDYLQIDQVVTNLLENAARYTPAGTPIAISVTAVDHALLVSIADSGPGIPPSDLERIFDKFYRVSGEKGKAGTRSSTMGTGLGLAVCRGLIDAHGGKIWAENRPEGGAVFRFTLPLTQIEEGQLHE